ncbi:MAG: PQQ-dependent dehydrogenase, methanol/ethanol family [Bryobacterales bacterium]|nr:PQQ-dependent dehydrogenase, methanol/ethanol family [Bryobacterales bacterium]
MLIETARAGMRLGFWLCAIGSIAAAQPVTTADLENAAGNNGAWLSYGRDYHAHRYVELDEITPANVQRLRPVWAFATGGENGGLEATPLLHNGVLYVSADGARVFAIDARTGAKIWSYDPATPDEAERGYCCGSINRGVALLDDLVYVGTLDSRLVALNKDTGEVAWDVEVVDWRQGYTITGAPLAVKDMVLTGMAGGEFGTRGFVKAFDAKSGALRWTAYTIPGPGEPGNETWPGDTWKNGGGPTWTTGVYDPELELVYWQTGNAAPWNCEVRKGDNKWTAATIAIDADSGDIKWGYQYTPWDCWDYDAVSTPVLADLELPKHGAVKALFHHDKNGFFYALDRTNGEFLYADPIVPGINWTTGLDPKTGRPTPNPDMIATSGGPEVGPIIPSLEGAIDWQPLSYNPELKVLYFMSNQWAMGYKFWEKDKFKPPTNGEWYLGADYQQYMTSKNPGNFVAYDVVNRKVLWRQTSPAPFWAGSVATSSGLVFTGDMRGYFMAFDARTGTKLWQFQTGSGLIGSPITYELDGTQYVAVPSGGIGGDMTFYYTEPKAGNILVFALDGGGTSRVSPGTNLTTMKGALPQVGEPGHTLGGRVLPGYGFEATEGGEPIQGAGPPQPTGSSAAISPSGAAEMANPFAGDPAALATGERLYRERCQGCHKAAGGSGPNIFRTRLTAKPFVDVVTEGRKGMPAFRGLLDQDAILRIHAFVSSRDQL